MYLKEVRECTLQYLGKECSRWGDSRYRGPEEGACLGVGGVEEGSVCAEHREGRVGAGGGGRWGVPYRLSQEFRLLLWVEPAF